LLSIFVITFCRWHIVLFASFIKLHGWFRVADEELST
jgi:hypothetical protein